RSETPASWSLLHQILEHGLQVGVRRRYFVDDPGLPRTGPGGEPRVEGVGASGLDDDGVLLETEADDAVFHQQRARQPVGIARADEHRVWMLVAEIAYLVQVVLDREVGSRCLRPRCGRC